MKKFNEVMLERRNSLGLTRYRLSILTGISQQALLVIEHSNMNRVSFTNVVKIAKVLDIDLNIFKEE